VTQTEFELSDGTIHPHAVPQDEIPDLEEFQANYEEMLVLFQQKGIVEADEAVSEHK
jgi:hypothetical protein